MKIKRKRKGHSYTYDPFKDGITQSALGLWLSCREQFNLKYVEGWSKHGEPIYLHYGSASHYILSQGHARSKKPGPKWLKRHIKKYDALWRKQQGKLIPQKLLEQHELVQGLLECTMPAYFSRCNNPKLKDYNDFESKKWIGLEHKFKVPINFEKVTAWFPAENTELNLRGMLDGGFTEADDALWLFETKNLSRIEEDNIQATLGVSLQNMFYMTVLAILYPDVPIGGILYNVLRRPGQRRKVKESLADFLGRIKDDIKKRPNHYYMRYRCSITRKEIADWAAGTLGPMLIEFLDWWAEGGKQGTRHFMNPEALITKYGRAEMFSPIVDGNFGGFYRRKHVFAELESAI